MHKELAAPSFHDMRFSFASIVGDVEQQVQMALRKELAENASSVMTENFPIGKRAVDCRPHGAEITLTDLRAERRTSKLAIGELDS